MDGVIAVTVATALAVAISPMRTSAAILVLLSNRARRAGPLYLVGFVVGISFVTFLGLVLGTAADLDRSHTPTIVSVVILAAGCDVSRIASWTWQNRAKDAEAAGLPRWLREIESLSPLMALGLGFGLAVFSFKNLGLILLAALAITQPDISTVTKTLLSIAFVIVSCLGVAIPVGWYMASGDRATKTLTVWKDWLTRHNSWVTAAGSSWWEGKFPTSLGETVPNRAGEKSLRGNRAISKPCGEPTGICWSSRLMLTDENGTGSFASHPSMSATYV